MGRKKINEKIKEAIAYKGYFNPLVGRHHPFTSININDKFWTLVTTQGFFSKTKAKIKLKEFLDDKTISLGTQQEIVRWENSFYRSPRYHIYSS